MIACTVRARGKRSFRHDLPSASQARVNQQPDHDHPHHHDRRRRAERPVARAVKLLVDQVADHECPACRRAGRA